jgi:hypothetical protein
MPLEKNTGYCKKRAMYFAYTMKKTVYAMVKTFYLCDFHIHKREEFLQKNAPKVVMKDILKVELIGSYVKEIKCCEGHTGGRRGRSLYRGVPPWTVVNNLLYKLVGRRRGG